MKFPDLVREKDCKIPVKIIINQSGIDEDGAPIKAKEILKKCNYQSAGSRATDERHASDEVAGVLYLKGDIFTDIDEITSGEIEIFNEKRQILRYTKARNPDGTVNYTKIEVK